MFRKPLTWIILAAVVVGGVVGLYWFQPWKLVVDRTVSETLPVASAAASPATGPAATSPQSGTAVLATGAFITHEHDTSGSAQLLHLPDGRQVLTLTGLDTSNGPDLRVWLTDQEVKEGASGWRVFDDGKYVELGRLKGNKGDQVYDVPADIDVTAYRSVTIWCKRFSVSFGAAELHAA